ncbi:ABATE domain-containing protein [Fodinicola feengrottensis]|uniref:ABATE domain-containing protein n=1 Tax=Fodinicola feengrottensis TaxID=435914 RepID=UPI00244160D8|nr:ABATE domain-containing protein [Fodinicola feengrottensis]
MSDWRWDGGRPSLDLVNTYRDRKTGGRELLATPANLAEWLRLAGYPDAQPGAARLRRRSSCARPSTTASPL